jgi:cytochrome P450
LGDPTPALIAELDIDPYSDEFLADPRAFHAELRDAGPVVWLRPRGIYAMARHEQVHEVLQNWESFTTNRGFGITDTTLETPYIEVLQEHDWTRAPGMDSTRVRGMLDASGRMDPPEGSRGRRIFTRILSPAAVRRFREEARAQARAMVARLVEQGEFDAVPSLANAFPIRVLCDAVGLPEQGREHLLAFGDMAMNTSGPRDARFLASIERAVPAAAWVAASCKREALAPGGFGMQIYEAADAGEIPEPVAELMVSVFPTAGIDTTACTIANAIHALATLPDQWAALRDDPSLARAAFEEAVRWDTPADPLFRTTTRETRLADETLAEGRKVLLLLAAANRDPRRYTDPDRFDLRRSPAGHVGFGTGVHGCVGQMFARMEGEAVLGALAEGVETIELAGEPRRRDSNTLRSWATLPVRVTPRRGSAGSR